LQTLQYETFRAGPSAAPFALRTYAALHRVS
jgi:hypothetical protein